MDIYKHFCFRSTNHGASWLFEKYSYLLMWQKEHRVTKETADRCHEGVDK